MAETKTLLEKKLQENYMAVQEKELAIYDKSDELLKSYNKDTKSYEKTLNEEVKVHKKKDADIKKEYIKKRKDADLAHKEKVTALEVDKEAVLTTYQEALDTIQQTYEKVKSRIDTEITDHQKEIELNRNNRLDEFDKKIALSKKSIEQKTAQAKKDVETLQKELESLKAKYETKIVSIRETLETKKQKNTEKANKTVEKLHTDIEKAQAKKESKIADNTPSYEQKLNALDAKIDAENNQYKKKLDAIKSTMESKVARHEKFLKRAEEEKDNRGAKSHSKDIKALQKNADKEIKILDKEHEENLKLLVNTKHKLIKEHLEFLAEVESEFISTREAKLYEIKQVERTLLFDNATLDNNTFNTLQEELNQFNHKHADNERKQAETEKQKEIDIQTEEHTQVDLKTELDKAIAIEEQQEIEFSEQKRKEHTANDDELQKSQQIAEIEKDLAIHKLNHRKVVLETELGAEHEIINHEELVEYHQNDFEKQSSYKTEFLHVQTAFTNMLSDRAKELYEYEKLEASNRFKMKSATLTNFQLKLKADYDILLNKINGVFEQEKVLYEDFINRVAKDDLEAIEEYKEEKQSKINSMISKRDSLDSKAYKKEIKEMTQEIERLQKELADGLEEKQSAIEHKTKRYQKALNEAIDRNELALKQAKEYYEGEKSTFAKALDLLQSEEEQELADIKERFTSSDERFSTLLNQANNRNQAQTDSNIEFMESRVANEKDSNKEIAEELKSRMQQLDYELDEAIKAYNNQIDDRKVEHSEKMQLREESFESFREDIANKIQSIEVNAQQLLNDEDATYRNVLAKIDHRLGQKVENVDIVLNKKVNEYESEIKSLTQQKEQLSKTYEADKKEMEKTYQQTLNQLISDVQTKLQQDIKNIQ